MNMDRMLTGSIVLILNFMNFKAVPWMFKTMCFFLGGTYLRIWGCGIMMSATPCQTVLQGRLRLTLM